MCLGMAVASPVGWPQLLSQPVIFSMGPLGPQLLGVWLSRMPKQQRISDFRCGFCLECSEAKVATGCRDAIPFFKRKARRC